MRTPRMIRSGMSFIPLCLDSARALTASQVSPRVSIDRGANRDARSAYPLCEGRLERLTPDLRDQIVAAIRAVIEVEETRKVHMHAGREQAVGGHHVHGALARYDRGCAIDIRLHEHVRLAGL